MSISIVMQCGVFVNGIGWRTQLIILDKQRDVLYIVVGTFSIFERRNFLWIEPSLGLPASCL